MRHLCDSNVLVALVARRHPHHEKALAWLDALSDGDSVVLCRMTQISFLRLITTQAVMQSETCTNLQARTVLKALQSDERVEWIQDEPAGLFEAWMGRTPLGKPAPRLWMDAYLAAFAVRAGLRFVTFDRGFQRFRKGGLDLLVLS